MRRPLNEPRPTPLLLVCDDDEDDRLLIQTALGENKLRMDIHLVEDGEELLDYLTRRGKHSTLHEQRLPDLILLDLRMPKMDGLEVLSTIKNEEHLRYIPVVILTTSRLPEDIAHSYQLGANSYIIKPVKYDLLVDRLHAIMQYWFSVVELPH